MGKRWSENDGVQSGVVAVTDYKEGDTADKKIVFWWLAVLVCVTLCPWRETLAQDDVGDVASTSLLAGGDTNKRYFLIGEYEQAAPAEGFGLIIVVPGDDGGRDAESFVKRIYKNALPKNYLVAQLVPVKWTAEQQVMWPTEKVSAEKQGFSTEEFIGAVIEDVKNRYTINDNHIFTLCWSSACPAGYAYSLQEDSLATGSFIAMSAFGAESLPPLEQAKGRAYVLFQSATDERYPFSMAQEACDKLKEKDAKASLLKYRGKQSWQENSYSQIRLGIKLLERDHSEPAKPAEATGSPVQEDVKSARSGKARQEAAAGEVSGGANPLKMHLVWEISIPDALDMCIGDWNVDGEPEVLVSDANDPPHLHVIDSNGREIESVELPGWFWTIECGRIEGQPVLLSYRNGGLSVRTVDRQGNTLWSYVCKDGVNCAHWGDIDGDGNDEMVVGTMGSGLHGVNENGKRLWKASDIGGVLYQSVIAAKEGRPSTIIATGWGAGVHIFDSNGKSVDVLEIKDLFVIPIEAVEIDVDGTIQIFGIGAKADTTMQYGLFYAMAFDTEGKVAWERKLSAKAGEAACFASGDLDGDGLPEWVYAATSNMLAIASAEEEIATIDMPRPGQMAILSAKNKKGKLVFQRGTKFSCYAVD
jgi:predicted esterase